MEVGLALGSNLGDRLENLRKARTRLLALPGMRLLAQSPVYDTDPIAVQEPWNKLLFLNAVLIFESAVALQDLHMQTRSIECDMGRTQTSAQNAPRQIDIDLVYADALQHNKPDLVVPHPRWHLRRFVLAPLASVRPELIIPGQSLTVSEILHSLQDPAQVRELATNW